MKHITLKCYDGFKHFDSTFSFQSDHGKVNIHFDFKGFKIDVEDNYPFLALSKIRLELEKIGVKIMCNGARLNVYPSGAALGSLKAYELEMGKSVTAASLVFIFDGFNDIAQIATVAKQKEYYRKWLNSVGMGDYQNI